MSRIDITDAIFEMMEVYSGFEMICTYIDEDGEEQECVSSELPQELWDGRYEIIGYYCPECGDPVYLDNYDEEELASVVSCCPICEFEFE